MLKNFLIVIILFYAQHVNANAIELTFNGLSFLGNFNQKERYQVAANFTNEDLGKFNKSLLKKIKQSEGSYNQFVIKTKAGKIKEGGAKLLTFGLNGEEVERLKEKDGFYSMYKVYAQILIFDLNEKKVLINFPILSQHQEFTKNMPDANFDSEAFKKIYFNLDLESSVIKEWVKNLAQVNLKESGALHLQLRDVSLDDAVQKQLPDYLLKNDRFKIFTAQKFEYQLASNQKVAILPFTLGELGNKEKLRARFSDAETYELKLPEADYVIDLIIRKFKNAKVDTKNYDGYVFGSFITLNVEEPLTKKNILTSKFNRKNSVQFNKYDKVEVLDPWVFYLRAQDALFSNLTKQISKREVKKLAELTSTKDIKQQFKNLEEIIKKCR
tara:strand:- start:3441 stop:4592 length:1152 start_codon:yes stop_codon:yes gene_type:complete